MAGARGERSGVRLQLRGARLRLPRRAAQPAHITRPTHSAASPPAARPHPERARRSCRPWGPSGCQKTAPRETAGRVWSRCLCQVLQELRGGSVTGCRGLSAVTLFYLPPAFPHPSPPCPLPPKCLPQQLSSDCLCPLPSLEPTSLSLARP